MCGNPSTSDIYFQTSFFTCVGTFNARDLVLKMLVLLTEVTIFPIVRDLKGDLMLDVKSRTVSGIIRFYIKNSNKEWVYLNLDLNFQTDKGHLKGEHKLINV